MFEHLYNVFTAIYALAVIHYFLAGLIALAVVPCAMYVWRVPAHRVRSWIHLKWSTTHPSRSKTVVDAFARTPRGIARLKTIMRILTFAVIFPLAYAIAIAVILLGNIMVKFVAKWIVIASQTVYGLAVDHWIVSLFCLLALTGLACYRFGKMKVKPATTAIVQQPIRRDKPTVFYTTWDHITEIFTEAAYNEAMAWHRVGVEKGYRSMNEKIIVKPCFLYYGPEVSVGQKNRFLLSAALAYFEQDIKPHCWLEERSNVHVPFTSKDKKRQALDLELFGNPQATSHREAVKAILGSFAPSLQTEQDWATPSADVPRPAQTTT